MQLIIGIIIVLSFPYKRKKISLIYEMFLNSNPATVVTQCGLHDGGIRVDSQRDQEIFLFSAVARLPLGSIQPAVCGTMGTLSP
jgi:hypothetical protein